MDLSVLQKDALLIPTPGQTEQEYLAKYLKEKGVCFYQKQNEFDLNKAINESENYCGFGTYITENKLTIWNDFVCV